ncbi:hypothetical protein ACNKHU_07525 [Shigella flexneri]
MITRIMGLLLMALGI